jgi:hypothetical protein
MGKADSRAIVQAIIRGLTKCPGYLERANPAQRFGAFELRTALCDVLVHGRPFEVGAAERLARGRVKVSEQTLLAGDGVQIERMIHQLVSRSRHVNGLLAILAWPAFYHRTTPFA